MTMATPDHMKGINSLPSVQEYNSAVARARATSTRSWEEARARGAQIEALRLKAMADKNLLDPSRSVFGPKGSLSKSINEQTRDVVNDKRKEEQEKLASGKKRPTLDQIKTAAKAGKTIWADAASECFSELYYRNGIVHAEFNKRNPDGGYDYEVDLDTFLEWASDSLGEFFNAEIR